MLVNRDGKLTSGVSSYSVLVDASLYIYRDSLKKNEVWKKVANIVGVSDELRCPIAG